MANTPRRRRKPQEVPKKFCPDCKKEKATTFFFKVDSPIFPDGMINICRDCVRKTIDTNNIEQVISFLRQIDKPFIESYWNEALLGTRHPLGEYIRKINSLNQVKGKTFDNSDGFNVNGTTSEIITSRLPDSIETEKGNKIQYSDDFITKWGLGYKKHEYLKMEKFYEDMKDTHEIHTPIHRDMLSQLAKLSIKRDRFLESDDMGNYEKANKAFETTTKSAGFRPADRKGTDEATGIRSFSQIFEEVEKKGFRKAPPIVFDEDIVDGMIIALANYYHRIVGKQLLKDIPDDIVQELDAFFEFDDNPVELNDEEYEDLDFSFNDEDEE